MKKLLWVGDAACPSGFARATHEILATLSKSYDVTVLGINYNGEPHEYPYPIYPCFAGGDVIGFGRIVWLCDRMKPDIIVLQNDGWNIPFYLEALRVKTVNYDGRHAGIPIVAAVAVDAKNFNGEWLKGVALSVFWTQFALNEARLGGYRGPAIVIPLGVDVETYRPTDKRKARLARKLDEIVDCFIVGNVNRNQTRKRWDLTMRYFAEWVYGGMPLEQREMNIATGGNKVIKDAWLYLHTAPTGDEGVDVTGLAKHYRVSDRVALMTPPAFEGITEEQMRDTYCSFDVQLSTTLGEGFGFTTFEGASCGIAQVVPGWSALLELMDGAAAIVPCTSTCMSAWHSGTIGGVADEQLFIATLDRLYHDRIELARVGSRCLARAHESRFMWKAIGRSWLCAVDDVLTPTMTEEVWNDLEAVK